MTDFAKFTAVCERPENQNEDNTVNWDFVDADVHMEFPEMVPQFDDFADRFLNS